jgi:hypothetical protein
LPTVPWRRAIPSSFWYSPDVLAVLDDASRRTLHQRLAELLGEEHAATLLEFLPPVPWGGRWNSAVSIYRSPTRPLGHAARPERVCARV